MLNRLSQKQLCGYVGHIHTTTQLHCFALLKGPGNPQGSPGALLDSPAPLGSWGLALLFWEEGTRCRMFKQPSHKCMYISAYAMCHCFCNTTLSIAPRQSSCFGTFILLQASRFCSTATGFAKHCYTPCVQHMVFQHMLLYHKDACNSLRDLASPACSQAMRKERLRLLPMRVCPMRAKSSKYRLTDVSSPSGLHDPGRESPQSQV